MRIPIWAMTWGSLILASPALAHRPTMSDGTAVDADHAIEFQDVQISRVVHHEVAKQTPKVWIYTWPTSTSVPQRPATSRSPISSGGSTEFGSASMRSRAPCRRGQAPRYDGTRKSPEVASRVRAWLRLSRASGARGGSALL